MYETGLVVGRFQHPHLGHQFLINTALSLCSHVYVGIGSSQASFIESNPFPSDLRLSTLQDLFKKELASDLISFVFLEDKGLGNSPAWGDYIRSQIHRNIDLFVTGDDTTSSDWFKGMCTDRLVLSRQNFVVSGTACRRCLQDDYKNTWKLFTPKVLWKYYNTLKEIINNVKK